MPAEIEIKLQDLASIALGSPQLTNVNIAILQSLIEILLKKLNCQNETVSLNAGDDAKHLEYLLKTAKISPIVFNDENVEKISEKLESFNKLQEYVKEIGDKLDRHVEEVQRESNLAETVLDWENWPSYGCEHLCTTCDPENDIACKLLKNTDFIKKLLRRMSAPIVERMFYFEQKVETLNEEFTNFIKRAEEDYLKIHLLEKCMEEIEKLRNIIKEQQTIFISTMEEIQDMLDSKLDKIHMPALKIYIRDNFQQIDQSINTLQNKRKCPRAAGIIMEGVSCISCGNTKVCSDVGVQPALMLPDVITKSVKIQKHWCKVRDFKSSKKFATKSWNLGDFVKMERAKANRKEDSEEYALPKCKDDENIAFLEGLDGQLYRKG